MTRPIPVLTTRRRGFSLVLSLTVMAMLLLLCISIAALMAIELRVGRAAISRQRARLNALVGAKIALGELQRLVGPDQRVSANADILCDPTQTDPTQQAYYNNTASGTVVHPRWVGVWNSGRVKDETTPGASADEATKVIQRNTTDGYLMDSRFANGKDWATSRATKAGGTGSKRFVAWLVSGNEALAPAAANGLTPFTAVAAGDVTLVGTGTLGTKLPGPGNKSDADYLGARVAKVTIPAGTDAGTTVVPSGSYAYLVSDEGVKARINLADKFEGIAPDAGNLGNGAMARLQIPQRAGLTLVENPADKGGLVKWTNFDSLAQSVPGGWSRAGDFGDLALVDISLDSTAVKNLYFNDITFDSAGVASDTLNGGLKKDLTAYFNAAAGVGIADYKSVSGSGIQDGTALLTDPTRKVISPKLGLIYNWYKKASMPATALSETAATPLPVIAPDSVSQNYNINLGTSGSTTWAATYTAGTPAYANTKNIAPLTPVLTRFDTYYLTTWTPTNAPWKVRILVYPRIDLWNPYSVPIQITNARVTWASQVNMTNNLYYQYNSKRPIRGFSMGTVTLNPGQSITYVPRSGQDISSDIPPKNPTDIAMIPGVNSTYYLDRSCDYSGNADTCASSGSTATEANTYYFWPFQTNAATNLYTASSVGYDEGSGTGPVSQLFLSGGAASAVLQQVNLDPWCDFTAFSAYTVVNFASSSTPAVPRCDEATGAVQGPVAGCHYGFRTQFLDDSPLPAPGVRNTNNNPLVNANFRATRQTRHPYDAAALANANNVTAGSALTSDSVVAYNSPTIIPASATAASPLMSYAGLLNGNAKQFIILDVPRQALGLQSLGQLQGAPLVQAPWAPGIPFGNAFTPIQASTADLYARTGYTQTEENTIWDAVNNTVQFKNYIRQQSGGTFPYAGAYDLASQRTLLDWSYELNHALWDTWITSGIPQGNNNNKGWANSEWDLASTTISTGAAPSSRLIDSGVTRTGTYFNDANFNAYRAAYTLLNRGAFNVNSTSVVAWESLLGAFRGIKNPTRDGVTNSPTQTPYSRHLIPATGPIPATGNTANTAYDQKTWAGFRALDDGEVRTLAQKIVKQVKTRGPFLSLSDFVNRRLIPKGAGSYGDLTTNELNFLGTIQAAILDAKLNDSLSTDSGPLYLDRTKADATAGNAKTAIIALPSKVKDKLAGAPGYLLQSDVLQKLAPVLSARSDTFKIRVRGESEDGAEAYVELTVQRSTAPLIADTSSTSLPINPKAIAPGSEYVGNQLFGRRMMIARTRWLTADEI